MGLTLGSTDLMLRGLLHVAKTLVGLDGLLGIHDVFADACADDIDAVKSSFPGDASLVSSVREFIGLNLDEKVFGHLELAQHLAHPDADFIGALERPALAQRGRDDLVQMFFGCLQQFFSFARALVGQIRIATDNQSFPG